ncbi:sensitivity to high expression protein she9 [Agyrium rufum]|nr:sensitivity to high expression protein she9 [Agyrium rufum]
MSGSEQLPEIQGSARSAFRVSVWSSVCNARYASTSAEDKPSSAASYEPASSVPEELPSQSEQRRSPISKRFTHLMDNLQSNVFIAGQRLNDLTGYSGIEALKQEIEKQELQVTQTRTTLQAAKDAYSSAITQRSASQREVSTLLQRKHTWSPSDLERFTELYRNDHANETAESCAHDALVAAERAAEEASEKLSKSILARYHEEQIWSDKIRRMSTWGTWGLMGVNVLLFLVFQVVVEPWRRGRLVRGFEEKVREAIEKEAVVNVEGVGGRRGERAALPAAQDTVVSDEQVSTTTMTAAAIEGTLDAPAVDTALEEEKVVVQDAGKPLQDTTVTAEVEEAIDTVSPTNIADVEAPFIPYSPASDGVLAYLPASFQTFILTYFDFVKSQFSERSVSIRQVDLTAARLEGAMIGLALTSIIAALLRGSR